LMEIMQILKANNVAMNGTIDIRSNPAVRQQVMNVVRRTAAQQAPAPPVQMTSPQAQPQSAPSFAPPFAAMTPPEPSVSQRLQELETLRATGAISETEYSTKRQQILSDL
jgi:hypothetical protein